VKSEKCERNGRKVKGEGKREERKREKRKINLLL